MENINIKQEIMDLCNNSVEFWKRLGEEIDIIADDDMDELILKWRGYFVEHKDTVLKLTETKAHAKGIEDDLFENGKLSYEDFIKRGIDI